MGPHPLGSDVLLTDPKAADANGSKCPSQQTLPLRAMESGVSNPEWINKESGRISTWHEPGEMLHRMRIAKNAKPIVAEVIRKVESLQKT